MGQAELERIVKRYPRVAVDSSGAIYYLNGTDRRHALMASLVGQAARGVFEIQLSALTKLELLIPPLRERDVFERRRVLALTERTPGVHLLPVSDDVILAAAEARALTNMKTPDAIIAASAIVHGCSLIVGNDRVFGRLAEVPADDWTMFDARTFPVPGYVHLDDFVD